MSLNEWDEEPRAFRLIGVDSLLPDDGSPGAFDIPSGSGESGSSGSAARQKRRCFAKVSVDLPICVVIACNLFVALSAVSCTVSE